MPKRKPSEPVQRSTPTVPDALMDLPLRLKRAMAREDLNATQLAELADVSVQLITRALKGERRDGIRAASAIKLANALGVSVGWLVAGESSNPDHSPTTDNATAAAIVRETLAALGYPASGSEVIQDKPPLPGKGSEQKPTG